MAGIAQTGNRLLSQAQQHLIKLGFSRSLKPGRLHFAPHSHHPWPDVTEEAQCQYWEDSTRLLDNKWSYIFSEVIGQSRKNICELLSVDSADRIIEGTSTFELVARLVSSFDSTKPLKILTTDSEFYSFERLARRLSENELVTIVRLPTFPCENFESRLAEVLSNTEFDIIFISLVFFNTGFYADRALDVLRTHVSKKSIVLVDAYHAIGAVDLDLSEYETFYFVGGGYKYLSAGEGACFLICPKNSNLRPLFTGWLAEYHALEQGLDQTVTYPPDARRFAGGTYDPSGWYRLNATLCWWATLGLTPGVIHSHARGLQEVFLQQFKDIEPVGFRARKDWGNFLSLPLKNSSEIAARLKGTNVFVDYREGQLRIGFGYYQTLEDVDELVSLLKKTL